MINVHISPDFIGSSQTGGIRRVVEAMLKYFPAHGIQHVRDVSQADVIINHGAMTTSYKTTPIIHVGHGMYWSRQPWGSGYQEVNEKVVESMIMAVAHTAPSEWVARSIRRGGFFYPEVVYHGVDAEEFAPKKSNNAVLWNKARADFVSNPEDLMKIAVLMPQVEFNTTIGNEAKNVHVLHPMPYNEMKTVVASAGVYLCTARETFGIGTLEALAAGVPIAGWDWGGQSEIVIQGKTGYLAKPGNYEDLARCISLCLQERERLSKNAYHDARERWGWEPRIAQYANIVKRVHQENIKKRPKVSVLVTAYNLDKYLPDCLNSVKAQSMPDFECLVIDDANSDATKIIVDQYAKKDERFRYLPTPHNLGLPSARNFGFSKAEGKYIRHLDADDFLARNAIELEANALDQDQKVHIVYGHLESVHESGERITDNRGNILRSGWPGENFDWFAQMAHLNQLPSCSMMRREVLQRSSGYRKRMKRAEDAEFWCRVTSLGFRAKKFTQAVTYYHRHREDSKGAIEWKEEGKEPDWTSWFPWRMGAADYAEGKEVLRKNAGNHPNPELVPFGAQGTPTRRHFWYIHDFSYPIVSVIVVCGPGHEEFLLDALDSIQAQRFPDWECIVVNDTGTDWDVNIYGAPFAKVVNMGANQGAAAARNRGFQEARGEFIIWMDADDYWLPWFLDRMVAYAEENYGVIYSDLLKDDRDTLEIYRYQEFNSSNLTRNMLYPGTSVLIPRNIAEKVFEKQGGWDTNIPGMEDWDFQIAIHDAGFCAYHIDEALFVYRIYSSTKRESDYAKIDEIVAYIDKKWSKYRKSGEVMACGCSKKRMVKRLPKNTFSSAGNFDTPVQEDTVQDQLVRVEYSGPMTQNFTIRSRVDPSVSYRFGNNQYNKIKTVFMKDAQILTARTNAKGGSDYRIVAGATIEAMDPQSVLGRAISG